jgi:hypothetical protein
VSGQAINLTSPTPITLGSTFTKTFTTAQGAFSEKLDGHFGHGRSELTRHYGLGHDYRPRGV